MKKKPDRLEFLLITCVRNAYFKVLPALPVLELQTSLPRAPISEEDMEPTAETTVYSGQTLVLF